VLALTMGKRQPQLAGEPLVDASGHAHPGLIPIGIPVLGAPGSELAAIRGKAVAAGLERSSTFRCRGRRRTITPNFGALSVRPIPTRCATSA
jgi:hypothetical protein